MEYIFKYVGKPRRSDRVYEPDMWQLDHDRCCLRVSLSGNRTMALSHCFLFRLPLVCCLVNIYPDIMLASEDAANGTGGLLYYFYQLDEWSILPSLIFLGVGAMTDFGPLIANPKSFLLGAAAQFGIFAAYLGAMALGFSDKAAAAISIIGGADGPTSIFLAGKLQQTAYHGTDRGSGIFLYVTGADHPATDHEASDNRERT